MSVTQKLEKFRLFANNPNKFEFVIYIHVYMHI